MKASLLFVVVLLVCSCTNVNDNSQRVQVTEFMESEDMDTHSVRVSASSITPFIEEANTLYNRIKTEGPIKTGNGLMLQSIEINETLDTITWDYRFCEKFDNGFPFDKTLSMKEKTKNKSRNNSYQIARENPYVVQALKDGLVIEYFFHCPDGDLIDHFYVDKSIIQQD